MIGMFMHHPEHRWQRCGCAGMMHTTKKRGRSLLQLCVWFI